MAAGDASVAAAVSQAPYTTGPAVLRAIGPVHAARLTAAGLRDAFGAARGQDPHLTPIVAEAGELAALTTPDALPGYRGM